MIILNFSIDLVVVLTMETALALTFARVLMTTGEWTVLRGAPANTVSAMLVSQTQHASRSRGGFKGGG